MSSSKLHCQDFTYISSFFSFLAFGIWGVHDPGFLLEHGLMGVAINCSVATSNIWIASQQPLRAVSLHICV